MIRKTLPEAFDELPSCYQFYNVILRNEGKAVTEFTTRTYKDVCFIRNIWGGTVDVSHAYVCHAPDILCRVKFFKHGEQCRMLLIHMNAKIKTLGKAWNLYGREQGSKSYKIRYRPRKYVEVKGKKGPFKIDVEDAITVPE